jgi:hypothetical protein
MGVIMYFLFVVPILLALGLVLWQIFFWTAVVGFILFMTSGMTKGE